MRNDSIEGKREEIESRRAAFYGLLSKASRNLEETIEDDLKTRFAPIRTSIAETVMKEAKRLYTFTHAEEEIQDSEI